ncbi:MAG: 4'-phosphopantetheinyl transferase superfamily protein [Azoarcus sp.]|nr:4'-phosphopantetheinyl transferase superfamily protein [Azoarcus sp.]
MLDLPQDVTLSGIFIPAVRKAMEERLPPDSALRLALGEMSVKRRTEFVAGRICAARSLRKMGIVAEFPLPMQDRLPAWPSGVLGSISHCATMAVAMTAMKSKYCALGVDVESLIDFDVAPEIQQSVCRDEELSGLERYVPCRARSLTVLFSAKEALYKALFPLIGKFEDFRAAELRTCEAGSLVLRLTHDWAACSRAGTKIRVRYAWLGRVVVSTVFIPGKPRRRKVGGGIGTAERGGAE